MESSSGTTQIYLYFEPQRMNGLDTTNDANPYDRVLLNITTNKHKEVMAGIIQAINGDGPKATGFIVVADVDADHHFALPAVEKGLAFEFWYNGTAADASDWHIKTRSTTNYMMGGCAIHDTDNGGDDTAIIDADNNSNNHLNILTPAVGTIIRLCCDGLLWHLNGTVIGATDTAVVFADHA